MGDSVAIGIINSGYHERTGLLLHKEGRKKCVWNPEYSLGHWSGSSLVNRAASGGLPATCGSGAAVCRPLH